MPTVFAFGCGSALYLPFLSSRFLENDWEEGSETPTSVQLPFNKDCCLSDRIEKYDFLIANRNLFPFKGNLEETADITHVSGDELVPISIGNESVILANSRIQPGFHIFLSFSREKNKATNFYDQIIEFSYRDGVANMRTYIGPNVIDSVFQRKEAFHELPLIRVHGKVVCHISHFYVIKMEQKLLSLFNMEVLLW
jgi:hypothetical protein